MTEMLRAAGSILRKPVEGYNELKHKRYSSSFLVFLILAVWFVIKIMKRQLTGFRFNLNDPNDFSLLIQLGTTVIPFLLFVIANWAVCALMDGEGKFGEITTFTAIALIPYLIFELLSIPLSNILVLQEDLFLQCFCMIGVLWSLMLFFQGQRIVHNYSTWKTIGAVFLSICGVAIILVILLLLFSLAQQVIYFITTVYSEIAYRK